jgi:hypothetical protein
MGNGFSILDTRPLAGFLSGYSSTEGARQFCDSNGWLYPAGYLKIVPKGSADNEYVLNNE